VKLATALRIAGGVAVVAATVVVVGRTDTSVADVLHFASPRAHLLTFGVLLVDFLCRGARMTLLARGLRSRIPFIAGVAAQFGGETAAAITPSRVGADAGRMLVLGRAGVDLSRSGAIVVAEMIFEVTALQFVAGSVMILLPAARNAVAGVVAYTVVVLTTTLGSIALANRLTPELPPWLARLGFSAKRWRTIASASRGFHASCMQLTRIGVPMALSILALSAVHLACRLLVLPALMSDMLTPGLVGPAIGWPMLLYYAGALVPAPAGGGAVELAFESTLRSSLGGAVGAALIWWRVYTLHLPVLIGATVLAWATSTQRRKQRIATIGRFARESAI
jgi:uncharacterized membrane protein YbhN (UPF0104 family)